MMKKLYLTFFITALLSSCSDTKQTYQVTATSDYEAYLATNTPTKNRIEQNQKFWSDRLEKDSTQIVALSKLAGEYEEYFQATGDVKALQTSEKLLKEALANAGRGRDGYFRSIAKNYISQHRFKEAKTMLDSAYSYPDNKKATEMMLYDVHMELGNYSKANKYLGSIKDMSDFNYLIRLAKWSDYKGDLDSAIKYMEQAKDIAKASNRKPLIVWSYTNLADFYGHAGRIEEAYDLYLKTLELEPDNAYAKKSIAWIAYSYEENLEEANRILDSVMETRKSPDYWLLKAEMAEFENAPSEALQCQNKFFEMATEEGYGDMYNTYLIEQLVATDPVQALSLAREEVSHRATPETYHLLALAHLANGNQDKALAIIQEHVEGKTFEPTALFTSAQVYKANGMTEKVAPLKEELLGARFEVGPVVSKKIRDL
ncbi:tetratricopeptide repeat protein [Flavobacteriaceae bacterium TK19130]|nr:tetratricopeptide repeat protein [Thermobacterium salinum]